MWVGGRHTWRAISGRGRAYSAGPAGRRCRFARSVPQLAENLRQIPPHKTLPLALRGLFRPKLPPLDCAPAGTLWKPHRDKRVLQSHTRLTHIYSRGKNKKISCYFRRKNLLLCPRSYKALKPTRKLGGPGTPPARPAAAGFPAQPVLAVRPHVATSAPDFPQIRAYAAAPSNTARHLWPLNSPLTLTAPPSPNPVTNKSYKINPMISPPRYKDPPTPNPPPRRRCPDSTPPPPPTNPPRQGPRPAPRPPPPPPTPPGPEAKRSRRRPRRRRAAPTTRTATQNTTTPPTTPYTPPTRERTHRARG